LLEDNTVHDPLAMKTVHPGRGFVCGTNQQAKKCRADITTADQPDLARVLRIARARSIRLPLLPAVHPRASVMRSAGLLKRSRVLPVFSMNPLNRTSGLVRIVHSGTETSNRGSGTPASGHDGCRGRIEIAGRSEV